jgi:LysM repeat protein
MFIMIKSLLAVLSVFLGTCLITSPVYAQTDNMRVAVANLNQDVISLGQQMRTLRLEMEEMRRVNARLRAQVAAASSNQETENQITNLSAAIETLRREYRQADELQKQQIITEVSRQIDALAKETQVAINTVASAVGSQPKVSTPVRFSEDYPKSGVTYTVRSGDTLSKIAREHGSTIKHIQNANKIVNPAKDLQVGQTIFIPISE